MKPEERSFLSPLRNKVILAFFLACTAVALAVATTYFSFDNLLGKMDELSVPNQRMKTLNHLFRQLTRLDQSQRADIIRNPGKPMRSFLLQSNHLSLSIDSLLIAPWEDSLQLKRLEEMKRLLKRRDYYLIEYLKLKSGFSEDSDYSRQIDSLAGILLVYTTRPDSTVKTAQKKTVTTYYPVDSISKKTNFLTRLFSARKKETTPESRVRVTEELDVTTDTLAITRQDSAVQEVGRIMKTLEADQRFQSRQIQERELELVNTNLVLIGQALHILHDVEAEEISSIQQKNTEATTLVNDQTRIATAIIVIFFLLAALLIFLILMDISKSNYYRLQLIHAREEAENLGKIKQRFLANMSHEIRTPLQTIIGYTDLLKDDKTEESIHAIQSSSRHLLQIVNEVLDYTRLESEQLNIRQEPFYLNILVQEVTAAISIQAKKKGLEFIVDTDPLPDAPLLGDDFRIRQVLYNLLGNALKFTHRGTVHFDVRVFRDIFVTCRFIIRDTGIGISDQDKDRVFREFEQVETSAQMKYGGAGLGLSIVKRLVDLQHGEIEVVSETGKGSTFTVTLKFEPAPPALTEKISPERSLSKIDQTTWIVDDDAFILRLCGLILEKNKIPHRTVNRSEEILEADLSDAHCVLLDMRMPKLNGYEAGSALRKKYPSLRIIALTAQAPPFENVPMDEGIFDDVLAKPFQEKDLLDKLYIVAVVASSQAGAAQIDFSPVHQMTMGDKDLFRSVMLQFVTDTKSNLDDLIEENKNQNADKVRELVHQLAGRTGQVGAVDLGKKLRDLESKLDSGTSLSDLATPLEQVIQLLKNIILQATEKE